MEGEEPLPFVRRRHALPANRVAQAQRDHRDEDGGDKRQDKQHSLCERGHRSQLAVLKYDALGGELGKYGTVSPEWGFIWENVKNPISTQC